MEAAWLPPPLMLWWPLLMVRRLGREGGVSAPCGRPRDNKPDRPPTYVRNACAAVGGAAEEEILHGFHRNGKRDGC